MVAALLVWAGQTDALAQQLSKGCLQLVTEGADARPVLPCPDADPLNLANDRDVRKVMEAFGIEPGKVRFRGCAKGRFSAGPDGKTEGAATRYLVTYPVEAARSYIAPISHELAHVLQMEMAGGLTPMLHGSTSKRIELGADFLTGIVFQNFLQNININQFQHNSSVYGLYFELDEDAHGTPSQRTGAFRNGVYFNFNKLKRDIRMASEHFQADLYGHIVHY